jgi:hypothetical protein
LSLKGAQPLRGSTFHQTHERGRKMLRKLLKSRAGTAEIVGTVLFLIILFFFFSNVFLWHNQVTREMDQIVADKTNSAVRIETAVLSGPPVTSRNWQPNQYLYEDGYPKYSLTADYAFSTGMDTAGKIRLIADLRLSIYASFVDYYSEPCFVYVLDWGQDAWMNTGLTVMNGYRWSNTTLSVPSSFIDGGGSVRIRIADASSQLGINDTEVGVLNIGYMAVFADSFVLEVTNLGGTDATLSRLWMVNATRTDVQTDHVYADFEAVSNDTLVAGGSSRTIMLSTETTLADGEDSILVTADGDGLVIHYVPPGGQTVIFRVSTTLGNTAACSYTFT